MIGQGYQDHSDLKSHKTTMIEGTLVPPHLNEIRKWVSKKPLKCDVVEPMLYSRKSNLHRQVRS